MIIFDMKRTLWYNWSLGCMTSNMYEPPNWEEGEKERKLKGD